MEQSGRTEREKEIPPVRPTLTGTTKQKDYTMKNTLALAAATILLAALPAHTGVVEDPVTHWKTYVPDTGYPAPQYQPPPVRVDPRHPSIQIVPFSCYVIGNIITCGN